MTRDVVFVHGAGEDGYLAGKRMAALLGDALGAGYRASVPRMPEPDRPVYRAWRDRIHASVDAADGPPLLVGHSLGGSFVLKALAEGPLRRPVAGAFLISAPYWGAGGWEVEEYRLGEGFGEGLPEELPLFLYHGREDGVVPFEHLVMYRRALPRASFRELPGAGHEFGDLRAIARDIRGF